MASRRPDNTQATRDRIAKALEFEHRSPEELDRIAQGHERVAKALGHGSSPIAQGAREVADRKRNSNS